MDLKVTNQPVALTKETAGKVQELIRRMGEVKPDNSNVRSYIVPGNDPYTVKCGAVIDGNNKFFYYSGQVVVPVNGVSSGCLSGVSTEQIYLFEANQKKLNSGQCYNAIRYGDASGVPVYVTHDPGTLVSWGGATGYSSGEYSGTYQIHTLANTGLRGRAVSDTVKDYVELSLLPAGSGQMGAVTTGTQTFAGDKSFLGVTQVLAPTSGLPGLYVDGGITIWDNNLPGRLRWLNMQINNGSSNPIGHCMQYLNESGDGQFWLTTSGMLYMNYAGASAMIGQNGVSINSGTIAANGANIDGGSFSVGGVPGATGTDPFGSTFEGGLATNVGSGNGTAGTDAIGNVFANGMITTIGNPTGASGTFWATPAGASGTPSFRRITVSDLPITPSSYLVGSNNLSDVADASTSRTNLGLGSAAQQADTYFLQVSNNLSDIGMASTARTNLGLGGLAVEDAASDVGSLTDSTGGTANTTLVAISGTGDDANINDNFADLVAHINSIRSNLQSAGLMA